ncbi:12904_t:CDS:1, partial [Acaulospora colombiana]
GENADFLEILREALKHATLQLSAYFWECAPVSSETTNKRFEFVATKSENLDTIRQNFSNFIEHISKNRDKYACSFLNLGKDAILIIPVPHEDNGQFLNYKNISRFTQNAPIEQQNKFWKEVADRLHETFDEKTPRWLSTNGLGVHYLHVRIDEFPKYYAFDDYRNPANANLHSPSTDSSIRSGNRTQFSLRKRTLHKQRSGLQKSRPGAHARRSMTRK